MKDKELIELLKKDPEKGLAETVKQYSAYVMKVAYVSLSDVSSREDMEEAVSDIFLLFYQSGVSCGFDIRSIRGMLSVIAKRHCIDLFRRYTVYSDVRQEISFDEIENTVADPPDISGVSNARLVDAIKRLGSRDENIFIRKYYFGQKSSDIAKDLNMKTNTVNKRISRGLKRLKKILEEDMQ